jgi:hypothetical protein
VSGGVSVSESAPQGMNGAAGDDATAAAEGGARYTEHVRTLMDLKSKCLASYAALDVGEDLEVALEDARRRLGEAKQNSSRRMPFSPMPGGLRKR